MGQIRDTSISNPADGEVLGYQASSGLWVNQTGGGIPSYATRPVAPTTGLVIYNSTKGNIELYNGIFWVEVSPNSFIFNIEYLVIAGGGSGGRSVTPQRGVGGGGAGGYRTNYATETSGGGGSTEPTKSITAGVSYSVTIGVGGASKTTDGVGNNGLDSVFDNITAVGGGGGGSNSAVNSGGSGGGGVKDGGALGGAGTANQGYKGGAGFDGGASPFAGGGGGGAGALGGNANSGNGGNGGAGVESSITGTPTYRGGGGGGGRTNTTSYTNFGSGGIGGGGGGSAGVAGTDGTGGGGGGAGSGNSGKGGDGIVILRYPDTFTISGSGGLTISSETSAGGYKYVEITAGTGTISFG